MMDKHTHYMNYAYELALKGWGKTSPNPMVGAVIVKKGKVISEGWHARCGADHAEAMAIKKAGDKAKGAELYVTLEPCSHVGRTPPCTDAIIAVKIKKIYVGVLDPNPRMNGKSIALLRKAGIKVEVGFLQKPLNRLNEAFNKSMIQGMPFVTAKIAQTIDGKIATLTGESKWITSKETRKFSRTLRNGFDAIAVGINTVLKDDPKLNATDPDKRIKKIIFDSQLRTPANASLFKGTPKEDIFIFTTQAPSSKLKDKAIVIKAPVVDKLIDMKWSLKELHVLGVNSVLIEGGSTAVSSALRYGLVDKLHIYIAPLVMGDGLNSVQGLKIARLKEAIQLKNMFMHQIGPDYFIEGYI